MTDLGQDGGLDGTPSHIGTNGIARRDDGLRHDWGRHEIEALFALPFGDLLFQAQTVHRRHFDPNKVQVSRLLSIKTGGCPEDCAYCPQSVHHETGVAADKLMDAASVLAEAGRAKAEGASRFCMGAAWRNPQGPRHRDPGRNHRRRARHGSRNLHDARHADRRPGPAAGRCRARLLQPQHRHLAGVLRRRSSPRAPSRTVSIRSRTSGAQA